jgi:hypothetical protein
MNGQMNCDTLLEVLTTAIRCWNKDTTDVDLKLESSLGDYYVSILLGTELSIRFKLNMLQIRAEKDPVRFVLDELVRILIPLVPKYRHDAEMAKLSEEIETYKAEIERLQGVLKGANELITGLGFATRGLEVFQLIEEFAYKYNSTGRTSESNK